MKNEKHVKDALIIYENLRTYILSKAEITKNTDKKKVNTIAVGLWQRRKADTFVWGYATNALWEEAEELNKMYEELRRKQKLFNEKLLNSQKGD
jgi:hypothetical protein